MSDWSNLNPNEWALCGDGTRWRYSDRAIFLALPGGEPMPVPAHYDPPYDPDGPVHIDVPQPNDLPPRHFVVIRDIEQSSEEYGVYVMSEV